MEHQQSRLPAEWKLAAEDLDLKIVTPFEFVAQSGAVVCVPVLLRDFGCARGMLIVRDFKSIAELRDEILAAGYGYSALSEPAADARYVRSDFIEMLMDWGWTGEESRKPSWLEIGKPDEDVV